ASGSCAASARRSASTRRRRRGARSSASRRVTGAPAARLPSGTGRAGSTTSLLQGGLWRTIADGSPLVNRSRRARGPRERRVPQGGTDYQLERAVHHLARKEEPLFQTLPMLVQFRTPNAPMGCREPRSTATTSRGCAPAAGLVGAQTLAQPCRGA